MEKKLVFQIDRIANEALDFLAVWREWCDAWPGSDYAYEMDTKMIAATEKMRLVTLVDEKAKEG